MNLNSQVPSWLSPEEELALRSGLKGRLASEFCLLQGRADALTRYLEKRAPAPVRDLGVKLLAEMKQSIATLERLSDSAADLALGAFMDPGAEGKTAQPVELVEFVGDFAACANEELAAAHNPLRVTVQTNGLLWTKAEVPLLTVLLANLLSNAARGGARHAVFRCTADRQLHYKDDGRGLNQVATQLLRDGILDQSLADNGGIGLLLIRQYAAAMGWTPLCPPQSSEQGTDLSFQLPPFQPDADCFLLEDDTLTRQMRQEQFHRLLQRELAAMIVGHE